MDAVTITTWMGDIAESVRAERDYLVQLDAAIGDGDHGINLNRGFDAVVRALSAAAEAAEEGMRATGPMQARKGRASYLGERSIGHQDPGATSTALIIRALERSVAGGG